MSQSSSQMRTPMSKVRGLGSAKSGTDHFWRQRLTGVANVVLAVIFVLIVLNLVGRSHAATLATLRSPLISLVILLFVLSGVYHMKLGMQTIIEDYVHGEGAKVLALMANVFFCVAVGLACIFAVFKISFGV
jgi:succinate dehydrogenase / fumarate reductase, membrane anchor subunit